MNDDAVVLHSNRRRLSGLLHRSGSRLLDLEDADTARKIQQKTDRWQRNLQVGNNQIGSRRRTHRAHRVRRPCGTHTSRATRRPDAYPGLGDRVLWPLGNLVRARCCTRIHTLEPDLSPVRRARPRTVERSRVAAVAIGAFEHQARILQFHQLPSLLIDKLAQALRDTKRLAAIGHHLWMETHPPVDRGTRRQSRESRRGSSPARARLPSGRG